MHKPGNQPNLGVNLGVKPISDPALANTSRLVAWDPVAQRAVWKQPTPGSWNGGVLATGGGLVFQGHADGSFNAYDDRSGAALWRFDTRAAVLAPPISYRAKGRQYVTVLTGAGTGPSIVPGEIPFAIDYRTQARRVLTFMIGGKATLPPAEPYTAIAAADPGYRPDPASATRGGALFVNCLSCHGIGAIATGAAPDLRTSVIPTSAEAFAEVVSKGALVPAGMPRFAEFGASELADLRQYIRGEADRLRRATAR